MNYIVNNNTGRKLNVYKTLRKRLERLMYVQFTSRVQGGKFLVQLTKK